MGKNKAEMKNTTTSKKTDGVDASLSLKFVIPIFFLNLVLQMAHFFPDLRKINIWDEAAYIHSGYRLLTTGQLPDLVGSPLSSVLYAGAMMPVFNSPDFFVLSDALVRILLFTLIFFSAYCVAREMKPYANPWVMIAFVFIVPIAASMYLFPSDALFAGFSGLAFSQMLAFYRNGERRHLWWASGLMGLGALVRAEGLLLVGVMTIITLTISLRQRRWGRDLVAVLLPFLVLVGGYIVAHGLATGNYDTGLSGRTFNNFESGHEVIYSQTGMFTPTISARLESRDAFGTPEENKNSVFRAISRNPAVYFTRLKHVLPVFWDFAVKAYGNKFLLIFIWLSLRGLIWLIHKRHLSLALMGVLWFVPLGVGFLNTFFREGYFLMPYFVVFAFSSIGLTAIIHNFDQKTEQISLGVASLLVLMVAGLLQNTSMVYRSALFIFGMGFLWLTRRWIDDRAAWRTQSFWILLVIGLIMRGSYPSPELPHYGRSDLEKSVYYLQDTLPAGSHVLAGAPANIWAARMTYFGINSYDIPNFRDAAEFLEWVQVQDIDAIYVDEHFPQVHAALVNELKGEALQEGFSTPENDIQIFLLNAD